MRPPFKSRYAQYRVASKQCPPFAAGARRRRTCYIIEEKYEIVVQEIMPYRQRDAESTLWDRGN